MKKAIFNARDYRARFVRKAKRAFLKAVSGSREDDFSVSVRFSGDFLLKTRACKRKSCWLKGVIARIDER
ncbi:MAG: hypothetical protein IPK79_06860 [Vampirovibrionales bacterium]|nr:hypothetical protein [Vampirovibrionales bacterium]